MIRLYTIVYESYEHIRTIPVVIVLVTMIVLVNLYPTDINNGPLPKDNPMLRDYQIESVTKIRNAIKEGYKRPILVLATGAGKSVIYGEVIKRIHENGKRALFLVNRRNLVHQFRDTLKNLFDVDAGLIMSGVSSELHKPIQLATIQTLSRRVDLSDDFIVDTDCVLIDEGHFAVSPTYKKVLDLYPDKITIGCTATPCRLDGRPLGNVYNKIVEVIEHEELVIQGYLSPMRYFAPSNIDTTGVSISSTKDFNLKELAEKADQPKIAGDCVENWLKHGENRKTLVFGVNVKHSIHLRDEFLKHGIPAEHLDSRSTDEERNQVFERMDSGETKVICNVALYTYGMDCPGISAICIVRPTKSFGLYRQMCGRGTRIDKIKKDCLLFDHGSNIENHGFIEDEVKWTLTGKEKAFQKPEKKEAEAKPLICRACNQIFIGETTCPSCGTEMKSFGEKIESTDEDLKEINPKKNNRVVSWEDKINVMGAIKWYCKKNGFKYGWVAHTYKDYFGVFPNDKRVKNAKTKEPKGLAKNILTHLLIKKAKAYQKGKR